MVEIVVRYVGVVFFLELIMFFGGVFFWGFGEDWVFIVFRVGML